MRSLSTRRRQDSYLTEKPRTLRCPLGRDYKPHEPTVEEALEGTLQHLAEKRAELDKKLWASICKAVQESK